MKRRLRYLIERIVSRPGMLMLTFAIACVFFIGVVAALTYFLTPADARDVAHIVWQSMRHVIDPGATEDDTDRTWPYRLVMLLTAIGGIFVIGSVVALLTSALYNRIELVRRGRIPVSVSGHTVVLGWSSQIYTILDEVARAPGRRPCVVILGELPKEEMEDAIRHRPQRERGPKDGKIRDVKVICRHGDPTRMEDLEIAGVDNADEILVPRPLGQHPDIRVLMTLLALSHRRWPEGRPQPVAAVISSAANYEAAKRALRGWPDDRWHVANAGELTARLIVQSRRHPGLTVVCGELVSFVGSEIYPANRVPRPMKYREALLWFAASLIGFRQHDSAELKINPSPDTLIEPDDIPLVVAAESTDVQLLKKLPAVQEELIVEAPPPRPPRVEKTLILGWNERIAMIVQVLDGYVGPGSEVVIIGKGYDPALLPKTKNLNPPRGRDADPTDAGVLVAAHKPEGEDEPDERPADDSEEQGLIPVDPTKFDSVIVLAGDEFDSHVDAKALTTLLLLQAIKEEREAQFSIICELEEEASRHLAWGIQADDLVLGQQVVSTLAVHFAKNPGRREMITVVEEWLDARDSDLYFEPAADYVRLDVSVTWATVVAAAARREQTAIGYVVHKQRFSEEKWYGVNLNPAKSSTVTFEEGDQIVVIANQSDSGPGGSA